MTLTSVLFNSILSIYGKCRNELASLHLVKSYCLPRLLYGCEGMLLSTLQTRELSGIILFVIFFNFVGANR